MPHVHNGLHRASQLQQAYAAALGEIDAGFSGIERAGETLTPTIDLWSLPEWAALRGEALWGGAASVVAGAAGTFAKAGVHNPAASGLICVVTHHVITGVAVSVGVSLEMNDTLLADQGAVIPRDRRFSGTGAVLLHSEASAGAADPNVVVTISAVAGENVVLKWPVVLPPGTGLRWRTSDDAAPLIAAFRGYLRRALPGELE